MKFIQYLIEKQETGRHEMTYHKLISALDDAYVSKKDNYFEFNLGTVVKDATLSGLTTRIQKGTQTEVKLGKNKNGDMVLVIFTPTLPERSKIDSLLSKSEDILAGFVENLNKFYTSYRNDDEKFTSHEKTERMNSKDSFEDGYDALVDAIEQKFEEYNAAVAELDKEEQSTVHLFTKSSLQMAKDKLKKDYFGSSEKEFVKKMHKLPAAEFVQHLNKEAINKLNKRLQNYYEQKF